MRIRCAPRHFTGQTVLVLAVVLMLPAAWPPLAAAPASGGLFTGVVTAFDAVRHTVTLTRWHCGRPQSLSAVFFQAPKNLRRRTFYWHVAIAGQGHYRLINYGYQARLRDAIKPGYLLRAHYRALRLAGRRSWGIDQVEFLDPQAGRKSLDAELESASRGGDLRFVRKNRKTWNGKLYPGFYVVYANGRRGPLPVNFLHFYRVYRIFYRDDSCGRPAKKIHWVIGLKPAKQRPWLRPPRPKLSARPPG